MRDEILASDPKTKALKQLESSRKTFLSFVRDREADETFGLYK